MKMREFQADRVRPGVVNVPSPEAHAIMQGLLAAGVSMFTVSFESADGENVSVFWSTDDYGKIDKVFEYTYRYLSSFFDDDRVVKTMPVL